MSRLARFPYRVWLMMIFLIALAISAIDVPYPSDFIWEHVLTVVGVAGLLWLEFRRRPLSNASYTLIFIYLLIHVLGAHYTYSEVPYDEWSRSVFGSSISEMLGQQSDRNHYDRLVHLMFGVLLMHPLRELIARWMNISALQAIVIAALMLMAIGTLYELLEWLYAEFAGADVAEHYNGQQGDVFDPQKDLALNTIGSVIGGIISAMICRMSTRQCN